MSASVNDTFAHDSDLSYADVITKCIDLLMTPNAFLGHYLNLCSRIGNDRIRQTLAFFLQARFKLDLQFKATYLDRRYEDEMWNSSVMNKAYDLLPNRYQERFNKVRPFSGFTQFFSGEVISPKENQEIGSILQLNTPADNPNYRKDVTIYQLGLDLVLEDAPSINDALGSQMLPRYQYEPSYKRTADLIHGLGGYFERNDYGGVNYQQLCVLAECMAYMKRFYRKRWSVEVEDVMEAWFIINYCKQPRPPLSPSRQTILDHVKAKNRGGSLPTQRQIIKKTGLATKTVNHALGLKITSAAGAGTLIVEGYVEYDDAQGGYRLTELGELALDSDFHVIVGEKTYQPKNPLES